MSSTLELSAQQQVADGKCRRTLKLSRRGSPDREFFFEFSEGAAPGEIREMDPFVFAVIFLAMQERCDLRIHGPMTRSAVRNLTEFQAIWSEWKPSSYRPIELQPEKIVDLPPAMQPARAIAAFSGGVDSVFTALSHAGPARSAAALPLTDLLLVQGFDIGMDDTAAFQRLRQRSTPIVEKIGLGFRSIRTNLKSASGQNWEDSFAAQLTACLHHYAPEFAYALLASSEAYELYFLPWGSNPITDHLLASDRMQFVLDGCRHNRTKKVAAIAAFPEAVAGLNVCWESASGSNCGRCEKCVRTQLNFLAAGHSSPSCFQQPLNLRDVRKMRIRHHAQYFELVSLRDHAREHDRSGAWLRTLKLRMLKYQLWNRWLNAAIARLKRSALLGPARHLRSLLRGKS